MALFEVQLTARINYQIREQVFRQVSLQIIPAFSYQVTPSFQATPCEAVWIRDEMFLPSPVQMFVDV